MKKVIIIAAGVLFSLVSFAQKINDPNAEIRDAKDYHGIKISGSFDVYITQGNEEGVAVSASRPEYKERIKTSVENGVLIISFDSDKKSYGDKPKRAYGDRDAKPYSSERGAGKGDLSGICDKMETRAWRRN